MAERIFTPAEDLGTRKKEGDCSIDKEFLEHYLNSIGLKIDDIKNKRIIDIGAGERKFAASCLKNGINIDVYSVDPNLSKEPFDHLFLEKNFPNLEKDARAKTVMGKRESLPFKNESFDLAINLFALPGKKFLKEGNWEEMKRVIDVTFDEIIRVLKHGGEVRIYPLEFYPDDQEEKYKPWKEAIENKLRELQSSGLCDIKLEVYKAPNRKISTTRIIIVKK